MLKATVHLRNIDTQRSKYVQLKALDYPHLKELINEELIVLEARNEHVYAQVISTHEV